MATTATAPASIISPEQTLARTKTTTAAPAPALASILSQTLKHSPRHRSSLYDSYELQAITKQLNRAINGSPSPTVRNPAYQALFCIHKDLAKAPKRISNTKFSIEASNKNEKVRACLVRSLWSRFRKSIVKSK
nr:hypothetical protein CDL12_08831 [Ipomoea batatas]